MVLSAHFDHLGVRNGVTYNGADDNASGTAAVLEIARWFLAHPPEHSIIVALFDGEEAGLLGASALAVVERQAAELATLVEAAAAAEASGDGAD